MKTYDELFAEFISTIDFGLVKNEDGTFSLYDYQGANLGNIESERFTTAKDMVERLDIYINDYFLDDDEWGTYGSCAEALEKCPEHPCKELFDLIVNHIEEVNLANAYQA